MAKRKSVTGIKRRPKLSKSTLKTTNSSRDFTDSNPQSERSHHVATPSLSPFRESQSRKRKRNTDEAEIRDQQLASSRLQRGFPRLEPQVRYISQDVVHSKWKVVPKSTADKIKEIFHSIEMPILSRQSGESRQIKVQQYLASIVETLGKRLSRVPFPPRTKELHFDYEGLLKENRVLEQSLNHTVRSSRFLNDEIIRQKALLESDEHAHRVMEETSQTNENELQHQRNDISKYCDFSARQETSGMNDSPGQIGLLPLAMRTVTRQRLEIDATSKALVTAIEDHSGNLYNNLAQVTGISNALLQTRSGLDGVLYRQLGNHQYEMLVDSQGVGATMSDSKPSDRIV